MRERETIGLLIELTKQASNQRQFNSNLDFHNERKRKIQKNETKTEEAMNNYIKVLIVLQFKQIAMICTQNMEMIWKMLKIGLRSFLNPFLYSFFFFLLKIVVRDIHFRQVDE